MIGLAYSGSGDHLESYFVKATSPDEKRAFWIRGTIFARADELTLAEGWAVAFDRRDGRRHVAVKRSLPYDEARFAKDKNEVSWQREAQRLELSEVGTRGSLERAGHTFEWDMRIEGEQRPFSLVAHLRAPLPKTKTVTPLPDARFFGTVTVDGERWGVDGWRGMLGHNWGPSNTELYAWFHCNQWEGGEELAIEAACARLRLGVLLPPLTSVVMRTGGRDYLFNGAIEIAANRGSIGLDQPTERSMVFSAQRGDVTVEGRIDAAMEDFVGLYYPNPRGPMTYCLNAKLAHAELRVRLPGAPMELRSHAAALEIGTRRADHGVTMHV